jgi:hypothetical protein
VGLDGDGVTRAGKTDIIQAGVTEVTPTTGEQYCSPPNGPICVYPWWNTSFNATAARPIVMTVSPGDSITVTIWQVSGDNWAITLDDNTTGQDFRTVQTYAGPGATAEYIVDTPAGVPALAPPPAPSTATSTTSAKPVTSWSIEALGAYSPAVQFTNLHVVGIAKSTAAVLLIQNGVQVSTPSIYVTAGFTVGYGSIVPTAP